METLGSRPRPDRILVPLDGSDLAARAISYADGIGGAGAALVLLRVAPSNGQNAARAALDVAAVELRRADPARRVEVLVAEGDPAAEIVATATRHAIGLVVMATSGRARDRSPTAASPTGWLARRRCR